MPRRGYFKPPAEPVVMISIGYGRNAPRYAITNDYFNSFSAIFGPGECLLNGKRYSLGHFAVEALEMDTIFLRKLKDAVADFKPELEVFLAARTASSAAVAQQKLDVVWAVLAQLPAYKNFAPYSHGSEGLFHSMREHPDRTDDSVTEGTNFHHAMTHWLDRLERLSNSVDDFIHNTTLMLEDCLFTVAQIYAIF